MGAALRRPRDGTPALPEGTVTFLCTDLEGSTRRLRAHPAAYREAVRRHHALLQEAVEGHGGAVFETVGDAVYAAFARPTAAVAAALAGQLALQRVEWGEVGELRARIGLHTGAIERQGGHYLALPQRPCHGTQRCARWPTPLVVTAGERGPIAAGGGARLAAVSPACGIPPGAVSRSGPAPRPGQRGARRARCVSWRQRWGRA
jgi:hypothetical protein